MCRSALWVPLATGCRMCLRIHAPDDLCLDLHPLQSCNRSWPLICWTACGQTAWPQQPSPTAACCPPARDAGMWAGHSCCTSRPAMRWVDPVAACCVVRNCGMQRSGSARSYALIVCPESLRLHRVASVGANVTRPFAGSKRGSLPASTLSARPYCSAGGGSQRPDARYADLHVHPGAAAGGGC